MGFARRSRTAIGLASLLSALLMGASGVRAQCRIDEAWVSDIAPKKGQVVIGLSACQKPIETWLEVGTDPGLAGASVIATTTQRQVNQNTVLASVTLINLIPETTYYYRAHMRLPSGDSAAGEILSFRPPALSAVLEAECRYREQTPTRKGERDGVEVDFTCNGYWHMDLIDLKVSAEPDVASNRVKNHRELIASKHPFDEGFSVFIAYDDYPNHTVAYIRAEMTNPTGRWVRQTVRVSLERNRR